MKLQTGTQIRSHLRVAAHCYLGTNKQTNKQTNQKTNKQTNKQTNNYRCTGIRDHLRVAAHCYLGTLRSLLTLWAAASMACHLILLANFFGYISLLPLDETIWASFKGTGAQGENLKHKLVRCPTSTKDMTTCQQIKYNFSRHFSCIRCTKISKSCQNLFAFKCILYLYMVYLSQTNMGWTPNTTLPLY